MPAVKQAEVTPESIGEGRTRYLSHLENLMMVVIDFRDGPATEPDPPHNHPHEQITYVVEGKLIFFLDGQPNELGPGDMITVPSDVPHTVQTLTDYVRVIDAFQPNREEFIANK